MGANKIVRLCAVLSICMITVACTSTTGPDNELYGIYGSAAYDKNF